MWACRARLPLEELHPTHSSGNGACAATRVFFTGECSEDRRAGGCGLLLRIADCSDYYHKLVPVYG